MAYAAPEDVAARLTPDASARSCDTIRGSLKGGPALKGGVGAAPGVESVKDGILLQCHQSLALGQAPLTLPVVYEATALSLRNVLVDRLRNTEDLVASSGAKRVSYLSMEFLVGRVLQNALINLHLQEEYAEALKELGYALEEVAESEVDPALGNGGLGRLASCFLDSLASLSYPAYGYGIRYRYGMLRQEIRGGKQVELPDLWLGQIHAQRQAQGQAQAQGQGQGQTQGQGEGQGQGQGQGLVPGAGASCPWEIPRPSLTYPVQFYGRVSPYGHGEETRFRWEGGETVRAVAHDIPIPGYASTFTIAMRLWHCVPETEFDLGLFNAGRHAEALAPQARAAAISSVLYPDDSSEAGKELRLKQEYFLVSATLQDIVARHKGAGRPLSQLPEYEAVQLNDTHPALAVPELVRILVDQEEMGWDAAWDLTVRTCSYTNHTILPEALERWPLPLVHRVLPRHLDIIFEINHRHLAAVERRWRDDVGRLSRMSIIEESHPKMIRMALLSCVGCHTVNGVAELHTQLVMARLLPDFVDLSPHKFQNKTNGVTHRRWLLLANPFLAKVISEWMGSLEWTRNFMLIQGLASSARDPRLHEAWRAAKAACKARLAAYIRTKCGVQVSSAALFDVQVKRLHEYKRQLLNILSVIHRYNTIKGASQAERQGIVPRVVVFAGKAAPGYHAAKCIIHLINSVAERVNSDPDVGDLLKVVFIPNYNVSVAEVIIPASDISQHISTAGMEASGTSNMKFAINGGLILGTMDGANIEIADALGRDNMFIFGALANETDSLRHALRFRHPLLDDRLQQVLSTVEAGAFGAPEAFKSVLDPIRSSNDYYLIGHDWSSYLDAQHSVDTMFKDTAEWTYKSIISTSSMGRFSSDRTIQQYAKDIWKLKPVLLSAPS